MDLINNYNNALKELYNHVGFIEDWVVCPIDDCTEYFWDVDDDYLYYAKTQEKLEIKDGDYYKDEIYKQSFYDKWVYEGEKYTMVFCDPHIDGVKWFRFLDNSKRLKTQND